MERCCGECKWWQIETIKHGSCQYPSVVMMRHSIARQHVPFAFEELEVAYVTRSGGTDCPCFERKEK